MLAYTYIKKYNLRSLNTLALIDTRDPRGGEGVTFTFSRLMSVGHHDESGGV
jgi:hypothetical protein